ncbi:MAG: hypothetical protein ABR585_07725 [Gemmatimonadaceae bacterium]
MADRFAWAPEELVPADDDEVAEAALGEGRHSAPWREDLHPRADDGKFGSGGGGSSGGNSGGAAGGGPSGGSSPSSRPGGNDSNSSPQGGGKSVGDSPEGGLPDVLGSTRVRLSGGDITMGRHADGDVTLTTPHGTTKLDEDQLKDLLYVMSTASDEMEVGGESAISSRGVRDENGIYRTLLAMVTRPSKNEYQLKVTDSDPSYDEMLAAPGMTFKERDIAKIREGTERLDANTRTETIHGPVDVYLTDDNKVGFRTLGGRGRPIEAEFTPKEFIAIDTAIDNIIDDMDAPDDPDSVITRIDVPTSHGKIRVEISGQYGKPGSRLEIEPLDGSWGIVVDGEHYLDWANAMSQPRQAGQNLGITGLKERQRRASTQAQNLSEVVSLTEAAGGTAPTGRRFRARLIAGDVQGSSGYYSAPMLKKHAGVFRQGLPVYLDHPGVTEAYERPERSVRDLAGRLATPATYQGDGLYADVEVYPHWAPVIEAMAGDIGMSIRASGTVEASTADNIRGPIVTSLTEASSVDFVTAAGAGGKIVALLESARSEGDLLRQASEALAPPFKKKGAKDEDEDKKPDDAEDDATDDDEEDDDELPAFLKKKIKAKESDLDEARNVGGWIESRLHLTLTTLADDMYGAGQLTRDERISLSGAIADALTAFARRVETERPHLYQRDTWEEPPTPPLGAMTEHDTNTTEGAPMSGSTTQDTPPERGTTVTESARVNELTTQLAESQQAASDQIAALTKRLDESDKANRDLANDKAARVRCDEALKESGLNAASQRRVTESVVRDLPTVDGVLDTAKLAEAIKVAIDDKKAELAEALESAGVGSVRGLGESAHRDLSEADIDKQLAEAFEGIGLDERAALTAAHGRA